MKGAMHTPQFPEYLKPQMVCTTGSLGSGAAQALMASSPASPAASSLPWQAFQSSGWSAGLKMFP